MSDVLTRICDDKRALVQARKSARPLSEVEAAARAGAQHAMAAPSDQAGIANAVRAALPGWTDLTVAPAAMTCVCPGTGPTGCASTTCAVALERYVSITVTRSFTGLLLTGLTTLRGDMTLRIR